MKAGFLRVDHSRDTTRDAWAAANLMRTAALLAAMAALFVLTGLALGGRGGLTIASILAGGAGFCAWFRSDRLVLSAVDAREADSRTAPDLVADVATLAERAGIPTPRVYVVASPQPNAFASGRDPRHAAIAVNEGLLRLLSREERFGVLAHEIAHIRNRDTLLMTITATIAGGVSAVAHWTLFTRGRRGASLGWLGSLALAVIAPLAASIVQMAISRGREYEADRFGAHLCGNPLWLASALRRLADAHAIPDPAVEAHPAMAPLFIVRPLARGFRDDLFATHPDVANRIDALLALAGQPAANPTREPVRRRWRPFADDRRRPCASAPSFLNGRGLFAEPTGRGPWA